MNATDKRLAAPCGLYCGICGLFDRGQCSGCSVQAPHIQGCDIIKCAAARHIETCASCPELPCTLLIQFTVDPILRTHLPCIENLRRQKKVGREAWLEEQARYWTNSVIRRRWMKMFAACEREYLAEKSQREEENPQQSPPPYGSPAVRSPSGEA